MTLRKNLILWPLKDSKYCSKKIIDLAKVKFDLLWPLLHQNNKLILTKFLFKYHFTWNVKPDMYCILEDKDVKKCQARGQ